jgi:hypothetical protein
MTNNGKTTYAKVTLSTGKIVLLRELRISDTENCAQACSGRSGGDANVLQIMMQKELLKTCIVQIDAHKPSLAEKEDMNSLFTMGEYGQLLKVLNKMMGSEEVGKSVQVETVSA